MYIERGGRVQGERGKTSSKCILVVDGGPLSVLCLVFPDCASPLGWKMFHVEFPHQSLLPCSSDCLCVESAGD